MFFLVIQDQKSVKVPKLSNKKMSQPENFITKHDEGIDDDIEESEDDDDDSNDDDSDESDITKQESSSFQLVCLTCGEQVDDEVYLKVDGKVFCSEECLEGGQMLSKESNKVCPSLPSSVVESRGSAMGPTAAVLNVIE